MFKESGSKKSLEIILENVEFKKNFMYFCTIEIDGDPVKRRTDISAQVSNPVFSTNKFFLPLHEERMKSDPVVVI
jgi:hypothetical protein